MTPLLFALFALFLLLAAFNSQFWSQIRYKRLVERRMEVAARICEAAARDSFKIELDHSVASLTTLDDLVEQGWGTTRTMSKDTLFVTAAYFGNVFVREHGARWIVTGPSRDQEPQLEFLKSRVKADPFVIIEYKLQQPHAVMLAGIGNNLRELVDHRCTTDGKRTPEPSINFEPRAEVTETHDTSEQ